MRAFLKAQYSKMFPVAFLLQIAGVGGGVIKQPSAGRGDRGKVENSEVCRTL